MMDVSFWKIISFHGSSKITIVSHYPLLKLNTLLLEVAALNNYGWSKCWKSTMLSKMLWYYTVTTMSAIYISKNLVHHSCTKHIDICHHFIRELVGENAISLDHVSTENQLAAIFTKALEAAQFKKFWNSLSLFIIENL